MAWGSSPSRAGESFLSSAVPAPSPLLTLLSFPGLPQTRANMHVDEVKFSFDVADNARHRQLRQRLLRYRKGQIERRKADRNDDQNEVEVASRGIEAAQDIPQQPAAS
jgi:hypothetical protein